MLRLLLLLLVSTSVLFADITIVHFGDSNTITSYVAAEERVDGVLEGLLKNHYKGQKINCVNAGQGGDYIRRFLDEGRYQKQVKSKYPQVDIACIRYGQNDMKHYSPAEFKAHLIEFIGVLNTDYPGIRIYLETGVFIDGKHWYDQTKDATSSCNTKYNSYWEQTRAVAKELKLPLVDQFKRWEAETKAGLWDLRIRLGAQKDNPEHPQHYYNAHANRVGVKLYAMELFRYLKHDFPKQLPAAGQNIKTNPKPIAPIKPFTSEKTLAYLNTIAAAYTEAIALGAKPGANETVGAFLLRIRKGRITAGLKAKLIKIRWSRNGKLISPDKNEILSKADGGSIRLYCADGIEEVLIKVP